MARGCITFLILTVVLLPALQAVNDKLKCFEVGGYLAVVFTPVDDDGALAVEYVRPYAQFLKGSGVDGVIVAATTGEGPTLNETDNKLLLDAWMEAADSLDLYVVSSVGGVPLPFTLAMANYSEAIGVDLILALPEVYFRPQTPEELLYNMQLIAEAAPNTPLMYDHIPAYTRVDVDMEEFFDLATRKIPNFRGVKSDVFETLLLLRDKLTGDQKLFAANYTYLAAQALLGFKDYALDVLNLVPKQVIEIVDTAQNGQNDTAAAEKSLTLYQDLIDLVDTITEVGNRIAALKEAMPLLTGIDVGPARPPLIALTEDQKDDLQERLTARNVTIVNSDA